MEKPQNQNPEVEAEKKQQQQKWGTWEELLLASAVNRHGFKDWDTVAMEVQSRTTLPHLLTTARDCEQKFHDLKSRFTDQCNDVVLEPKENGATVDHVPWLDELRKLRVAELRREVQRSDVSILSLQLKVKKLEEEKAKENDGKRDEKPDLVVSGKHRPDNDKNGGERKQPEPANSEPQTLRLDDNCNNNKPPTGDESDRENQSVNESNSTGSRFEGGKTGEGDVKLEPPTVHAGPKEQDPVGRKGKPIGEESNNGSYDTNVAKVPTCEERKEDDSSELRDSVAHSRDDGEEGTRESSEVQSSASLTRKRKSRRGKKVSGGDGGGGGGEDATENDEVAMKSEPLVSVLELIKGHEHSSLFERRLESQESDRYKNTVRQHLDLETIQSRLQKGVYSSCTRAFFRDLLLLFTNVVVFFPKDSTESHAAQQLRHLVSAELKNHFQSQPDPIAHKPDSLPPNPSSLPKPDCLFSKHKSSAPILVCRKRSSISAKPSNLGTFAQKGDPITNEKKEKPSLESKSHMKPSSSDTEEEEPPKAKEKPVTGARSLRRSNKNLSSNNPTKKIQSNSNLKAGSGSKPVENPKPEKSKTEGSDKKRSAAADFLKRIKRNAPAEAAKSGSGGGGGGSSSSSRGGVSAKEQKKMVSSGKGDKGKERPSRNSVGGGSGSGEKRNNKNENNSQSKRSVGRPPKKSAESNASSAKRGRESSAGKDKRPKKRAKK